MKKISSDDINKEGFAVLHGEWGGRQGYIVGLNGARNKNDKLKNKNLTIGYFAYPNPNLKNNIPDSRFYKYQEVFRLKSPPTVDASFQTSGKLEQSVTKSEYIKKIKQIKELLSAGEIYQLNYAIRFRKKFNGDPYALFLKLIEANPSDFAGYLNCGKFHIISSSPERLFKVEGDKIVTQPIKGTAPKDTGNRTQETAESCFLNPVSLFKDNNLTKLINSEKERAELDMITDLERNDIGKICEYGTLKLIKEREIIELHNLWHTYSEIRGKLRSDVRFKEIIDAMFPGGSITGCPKKRAMEYIEQLEGLPRNIFTGSIGYISNYGENCEATAKQSHNWSMDFSIAIRTALVKNGYIEYWAGGGIVADSDPEKEYEECLLKAEKFLEIL